MAKGQMRSNKEAKKPKKEKPATSPAGSFLAQTKPADTNKQK
ncbi:hypothetical protein ACUHMQ_00590 [Chitinimonas sp. PSY-7]